MRPTDEEPPAGKAFTGKMLFCYGHGTVQHTWFRGPPGDELCIGPTGWQCSKCFAEEVADRMIYLVKFKVPDGVHKMIIGAPSEEEAIEKAYRSNLKYKYFAKCEFISCEFRGKNNRDAIQRSRRERGLPTIEEEQAERRSKQQVKLRRANKPKSRMEAALELLEDW